MSDDSVLRSEKKNGLRSIHIVQSSQNRSSSKITAISKFSGLGFPDEITIHGIMAYCVSL